MWRLLDLFQYLYIIISPDSIYSQKESRYWQINMPNTYKVLMLEKELFKAFNLIFTKTQWGPLEQGLVWYKEALFTFGYFHHLWFTDEAAEIWVFEVTWPCSEGDRLPRKSTLLNTKLSSPGLQRSWKRVLISPKISRICYIKHFHFCQS